jgi:hypothetical protein
MKCLSRLSYVSLLLLISLSYYSCKSSSYHAQAVVVETKEVAVEKEVTASKTEDAVVHKEVVEVKEEEKPAVPSPVLVDS